MSVYDEIRSERARQVQLWGNETDDTLNTPWMWVAYICQQATRWMAGTFLPLSDETTDAFRKAMVKTAATAIAAIDSLDRQRADEGRAFYEQEKN